MPFPFPNHLFLLSCLFALLPSLSCAAAAFAAKSSAQVVHENLLTRRTIHDFEPTLPPYWEYYLEDAIEAACFAPNHKRTEPWRFHLLGPNAIQRVCELQAEMVTAKKGPEAGAQKRDRWWTMPGWLVVTQLVVEDVTADPSVWQDPTSITREDYAACCCAVQNVCLSLHSHGLGTKWTTGPINFDERFAAAVGLDDNESVVGTLWFGKPQHRPTPPPKQKRLQDVLIRHN